MRFITEEDLRELYKIKPFTEYVLESGARITPGARQFLMDRGINISDAHSIGKNIDENKETMNSIAEKKNDYKNRKLLNNMKSIEALFFLTEQELLCRDICLAQSVIILGKQFSCIKNAVKNSTSVENLQFKDCTGMNKDNYSFDLEECFEISEFHVQLEKSKEIVLLHRLRCALYEIVEVVQEIYEAENGQREEIVGKIFQIVNSISQLICLAYGGKKCQRQN